ncbi:autotransporter domain-containing protein [Pseudoxanthomonas winnipegensis]|uniref:Autotransporter domain-containing protein n=2 Tax=Pseudoxanthomonas winnipegensis TaxID=2480810 RepID=A0A4Q8M8Y0_9GAMM|nr:autotransporter domain-containing protein [Pseudoxanthomonas winnipegensis]
MRGQGARSGRPAGRMLVLNVLACAVMSACGGKGGGVKSNPPSTTPPPTTTPAPVVTTPDPTYSKHLSLTHADAAHAAGFTGTGVVIGIVDTGVNRSHPALSPRVTANLTYVSGSSNDLTKDDVVGHGTAVAQIAAGRAFGAWPGGIAPGASIVSARIISDKEPTDDGSGNGNSTSGALGLAQVHQDLIARGVKVMNNSWGGVYWTDLTATVPIAAEYRPFVVQNGGIVVFATGNDGKAQPTDTAAMPSKPGPNNTLPAADLEIGWLAVAALDTDNPTQLASYSNACGVAMHYCLVAPGKVITTGTNDGPTAPSYWEWTGTSLSTPQVSGAAALVWQAFPYFSNDLVRQTLLGTATDLGAAGVDPVFGYGLLNVGKAVNGPARLDWGDVAVSFDGTSTWSNAISGDGGITKSGAGTLNLSGQNSYLGQTRVSQGALLSSGAIPGSASVAAGARLNTGGGVGGALRNDGTVAFTGAAGARRIEGDFTQSSGATLEFQIGTPLQVDGTANLGGMLKVMGMASGYVRSARETVVDASAINGTFSGLSSASNVFLQASLGFSSTQAYLDITRLDITATASAMGMSAASVGAAQRVDAALSQLDAQPQAQSGAMASLAGDFLRTSSSAAAARSLESLSGRAHAAADGVTLDLLDLRRRALAAHVAQGGAGAGGWYQAFDGRQASGLGATAGLDLSGWIAGQDVTLAPGWTSGLAVGQMDTNSVRDTLGDAGQDRQTHVQAYLAHRGQAGYALAQFGVGQFRRDLRRSVYLGDAAYGVDARYDGEMRFASMEAGVPLRTGLGTLTPYLGADYASLARDAFSEQGAAGFGLAAAASHASRAQAIAGLRLERALSLASMDLSLSGHLEWQSVLSASGFSRQARFVGIDAWGAIPGGDAAASGGWAGFSLEAALRANQRLSFGLDQRFGARGSESVGSVRYSVGF